MKKRITIWLLILATSYCFSQDCDETNAVVLNGEIYDYELDDCTTEVSINTTNGDTNLHGITLLDATRSINIKPTGNNRVTIKPDDSIDFINLRITNDFISLIDFIRDNAEATDRTKRGNLTTKEKDLTPSTINVYPNPVDAVLNIETEEIISYYKIVTDYGLTVKEGTLSVSKQLNLGALTTGVYYLLLQTEDEIIIKRLSKN